MTDVSSDEFPGLPQPALKVVSINKRPALKPVTFRAKSEVPPDESGFYYARELGYEKIEPVEVVVPKPQAFNQSIRVYRFGVIAPRGVEMFDWFGEVPEVWRKCGGSEDGVKPVELKTRAQIVNERCVEICGELLARAERGEVETVFIIAFEPEGRYDVLISESMHVLKKIGCLERLKHDYLSGV